MSHLQLAQPIAFTITSMSWRGNTGQTGANTIPLGSRRRFGADDVGHENGGPPPPPAFDGKRGRSPERREPELNPDGTKKRRKRNRWGDVADNKAAGLMNLPTAITAPMTAEQLDAYVTHLRIEEISQKLRINDVVPRTATGAWRGGVSLQWRAPIRLTSADLHPRHRSTTTWADVLTRASFATARS